MFFSSGGIGSPFGFFSLVILAIVLIAAWIILAGSRFVQGGVVERPERVPQLYGYTACLIGLIMAITAVLALTEAALALRAPAYASSHEWGAWEPSVSSFEAFRATYDRTREMRVGAGDPRPEPLSEEELRRRYEGLRADRLTRTRIEAQQAIITSILSLLIGVGVFAFHWRWLRRRGAHLDGGTWPPAPGATA